MTIVFQNQNQGEKEEENRTPQILYGEAAHALIEDKVQRIENDRNNDENVVKSIISSATWKTDDEIEFDNAVGHVYVTSDRFLFLCSTSKDHSVSIDAECIQLHALMEDGVYLQLQDPNASPNSSEENDEVLELTMTLPSDSQKLFEALSLLVSMNPIVEDEEEEMFGDMGGGENDFFSNGEFIMRHDDDNGAQEQEEVEPSEEERNAMLDRLDAMLVIPPHLEVKESGDKNFISEGQFDDADDELL